jgi:hypothetical protein
MGSPKRSMARQSFPIPESIRALCAALATNRLLVASSLAAQRCAEIGDLSYEAVLAETQSELRRIDTFVRDYGGSEQPVKVRSWEVAPPTKTISAAAPLSKPAKYTIH